MELNDAISHLGDYSAESNLTLNEAKMNWMLVSTRLMSRAHKLHDYYYSRELQWEGTKMCHHS